MKVLIETLWNVKAKPIRLTSSIRICINRNIVECKEELYNKGLVGTDGINRNIVECKGYNKKFIYYICYAVLIETLWNVK